MMTEKKDEGNSTFFAAPLSPFHHHELSHDNCHLQEPGDQGDTREEGEVGVGIHHWRAALTIAAVIVRARLYQVCQSHLFHPDLLTGRREDPN